MGVERVFLTVILNEVLMTSTDFMEEKEVFELLGKKKTAVWRLRKDHGFPPPSSLILLVIAVRQ